MKETNKEGKKGRMRNKQTKERMGGWKDGDRKKRLRKRKN
jgi:hypothetical protein